MKSDMKKMGAKPVILPMLMGRTQNNMRVGS